MEYILIKKYEKKFRNAVVTKNVTFPLFQRLYFWISILENNYQAKVPIFKQFHKYIIGKGGATIKGIRKETDTKIDLPESGNDSDVITITGKKENVDKAQKKIAQIQSEMANVVSADIIIPAKIHNMMIGMVS